MSDRTGYRFLPIYAPSRGPLWTSVRVFPALRCVIRKYAFFLFLFMWELFTATKTQPRFVDYCNLPDRRGLCLALARHMEVDFFVLKRGFISFIFTIFA